MARFSWICKLERAHTVLQDIGETEEPPLTCLNMSNKLYCPAIWITTKDIDKPTMVALKFIIDIFSIFSPALLLEGEGRRRDILIRIIIESSCDYVFILCTTG